MNVKIEVTGAVVLFIGRVLAEVQKIEQCTGIRPTKAIVAQEDWDTVPEFRNGMACVMAYGVEIRTSRHVKPGEIFLMTNPPRSGIGLSCAPSVDETSSSSTTTTTSESSVDPTE